mmetsp:Transcript_20488/g.29633  ORF Transcript_20488/g.29633 Transcript_20488/m.29633 type:complete len:157 (+) Transcript_20488:55-525(+)
MLSSCTRIVLLVAMTLLILLSQLVESFTIDQRCGVQRTQQMQSLTQLFVVDEESEEDLSLSNPIIVERGSENDPFTEAEWEEIDKAKPSEWVIMKEVLGINIFTYILAALIVIFLSLNALLGPGWLGQSLGIPGVGTFTEVSPNLPQTVDLSNYAL